MDIGKQKKAVTMEPLVSPVPRRKAPAKPVAEPVIAKQKEVAAA